MAVMGLRLAGHANGVSLLHGAGVLRTHVRRPLAGIRRQDDIPITSITNGVHAPTWADGQGDARPRAGRFRGLRPRRRAGLGRGGRRAERADLGHPPRPFALGKLVADVRTRVRKSWLQRGASPALLGWVESVLDPDVLTIGFARRVPSYKRLTLMLSDPERLKALLLHPDRPIQIVIAGKSHPADEGGKRLIQEIVRFSDDPKVRHRIVFLPNYDIAMAQPLYPGCDVWLNNPLRPYEACGTSGMKSALNGGLNLSILDGWWDEWYDGDNGWAIPSADGIEDADRRDGIEASALYDLIENEVGPRFYDVDGESDLPAALARDGAAHAQVARPTGALDADGARLRPAAVHACRRDRATAGCRRRRRGRPRGLEEAGADSLARSCGSSTSSPAASTSRPQVGVADQPPGARLARHAHSRRRRCPGPPRAGQRGRRDRAAPPEHRKPRAFRGVRSRRASLRGRGGPRQDGTVRIHGADLPEERPARLVRRAWAVVWPPDLNTVAPDTRSPGLRCGPV